MRLGRCGKWRFRGFFNRWRLYMNLKTRHRHSTCYTFIMVCVCAKTPKKKTFGFSFYCVSNKHENCYSKWLMDCSLERLRPPAACAKRNKSQLSLWRVTSTWQNFQRENRLSHVVKSTVSLLLPRWRHVFVSIQIRWAKSRWRTMARYKQFRRSISNWITVSCERIIWREKYRKLSFYICDGLYT